jgi:hypothetical protein
MQFLKRIGKGLISPIICILIWGTPAQIVLERGSAMARATFVIF